MRARRTAPSTAMTCAGIAAALATTWFMALVVDLAFRVLS